MNLNNIEGYEKAPEDKAEAFLRLRVPILPLKKDGIWYYYRIKNQELILQCQFHELSIEWLKKQDQTECGRLSDEARQKAWEREFKDIMNNHSKVQEKIIEPALGEVTERCRFIAQRFHRPYYSKVLRSQQSRHNIIAPKAVVGRNPKTGALIRAYK